MILLLIRMAIASQTVYRRGLEGDHLFSSQSPSTIPKAIVIVAELKIVSFCVFL